MRKIFLSFAMIAISAITFAQSQSYPGYNTGNYTGVNGVFSNPANIVDSRYRWDVNLIGVNAGLGNSNSSFSLQKLGSAFNGNADSVLFGNSAKGTNAFANIDILGPSVMFNINPKTSIALTSRVRALANIVDIDGQLIQSINDQAGNSSVTLSSNKNQRIIVNSWADFGASLARVLYNKDHNFLKGGITLKYLAGVANTYASISNFSGSSNTDIFGDSYLHNTNGAVALGVSGIDFNNVKGSDLLKFKSSGFGTDLGFVYEYRTRGEERRNKNKYKFKISASVLDLGSIKYTPDPSSSGTYNVHINGSDSMRAKDLDGKSISEIKAYFDSRDSLFTKVQTPASYNVSLPTTVQLALDYNIHKGFYVNLGGQLNMVKSSSIYNSFYQDAITLTPRFEGKILGVYVPLNYNSLTNFNAGLSLRVGPAYFGSGSVLTALFDKSKQADFHFGLHIGVLEKKHKIKEVKTVETIVSVDTVVVTKPAPVEAMVVKDTDGDGIVDSADKCPTIPGTLKYQGCPIPDTDGDGVNDELDKCPTVPGLAKYQGCPIPDSDSDGVNDELDKCPTVPGLAKYQGCPIPDTDGDSLNDEVDRCPTLPGPRSNQGCPVIKTEIIRKVNLAAKGLQFQTGKAVILKKSYPALNNVIKLLKADTTLNLTIEGYTDNVGKADKNLKLSTDRAGAAKAYFVKNGIAESRLNAKGFGDANPIASNKTAAGKAKNRRVVFTLSNY